jgi:TatD DNase family protein
VQGGSWKNCIFEKKPMYIDTHTHLYSDVFEEDRDAMMARAIAVGVECLLLPNIDSASIEGMHALTARYPDNCYAMMGLHPGSVKEDWPEQLGIIEQHLFARPYIAVGEIGMDLYWDKTFQKAQEQVFEQQVKWAKELKLPIVIHAREAFTEIFEIMDRLNDQHLTGIFHCFTGNVEQANHILGYGGFKLGVGGVLTYKKAGLDAVLQQIALEHLVLETDSPYLPPVPFRGKRNESSYLPLVAERLSEVYGMALMDIAEITTKNARDIFKLSR